MNNPLEWDKEVFFHLSQFEDDILEIIDHQDEFTRSDLQGGVMAVVRKIYRFGHDLTDHRYCPLCGSKKTHWMNK